MSVPSSKRATTWEKPNFETERTSLRPFNPPIAYSTGKVMSRSVSSGESSGATVLIWTWTGVVSGKASSGKWIAERTPTTMRSPVTRSTKKRFFKLKAMMALSMAWGSFEFRSLIAATGPDRALHDFGLEKKRPGGHHLLAGLQAPAHLHDVPSSKRLRLDSLRAVHARFLLEEHHVCGFVPLHG